MREILFRGKEINTGKWVYGSYSSLTFPNGYTDHRIKAKTLESIDVNPSKKVNPETVGQYTGLTDKNGTKIFEGDIIAWEDNESNARGTSIVIYFAEQNEYPAFDLEEHDYECNALQYLHECGGMEVIGNIYDNPELMYACREQWKGKK